MHRILSILLLAVFGLPLVSPLLALGADGNASLPACCRKNGKHHCIMSLGEGSQLTQRGPAFSPLPAKCPYCPATIVAVHPDLLAASSTQAIFASLLTHPAGVVQTESKRRISRDRSRQKRGPPHNLL